MNDTGYEGVDTNDDEFGAPVLFKLAKLEQMYTTKVAAQLYRNGRAVGIVYLGSENEYNFLKERVNGTFKPED